jgi:hypothetical protein
MLYRCDVSTKEGKKMKYFRVCIALFILAAPLMANDTSNVITIGDFDATFQGFSFSHGGLVSVDMEATESLPIEIDFIFDLPNGLGMNNSELSGWFPGRALILDLGEIPLEKKIALPEDSFTPFLLPEEIIAGHTYLIKTADAQYSGRIRILSFEAENSLLTFNWVNLDGEVLN